LKLRAHKFETELRHIFQQDYYFAGRMSSAERDGLIDEKIAAILDPTKLKGWVEEACTICTV